MENDLFYRKYTNQICCKIIIRRKTVEFWIIEYETLELLTMLISFIKRLFTKFSFHRNKLVITEFDLD